MHTTSSLDSRFSTSCSRFELNTFLQTCYQIVTGTWKHVKNNFWTQVRLFLLNGRRTKTLFEVLIVYFCFDKKLLFSRVSLGLNCHPNKLMFTLKVLFSLRVDTWIFLLVDTTFYYLSVHFIFPLSFLDFNYHLSAWIDFYEKPLNPSLERLLNLVFVEYTKQTRISMTVTLFLFNSLNQ